MKKTLFVFVLVAVLATGTVSADGLGIGVLWGGSVDNGVHSHAALALKLPSVPVYWGIRAGGFDDTLWVGVQGDVYVLDGNLVPTLGWFLGLGLYGQVWMGDIVGIGFGGRVPIGLRWRPIDLFELFGNIVPTIGGYAFDGSFEFPHGSFFGLEIGIRLWF